MLQINTLPSRRIQYDNIPELIFLSRLIDVEQNFHFKSVIRTFNLLFFLFVSLKFIDSQKYKKLNLKNYTFAI